jgi:hypothetical protein
MVPPLSWSQVPQPKTLTAGSVNKLAMGPHSHRNVEDFPLTRDFSTTHALGNDVLRLALSAKYCTEKL